MTDPRNPSRPAGDAGANWAECGECGRGAHHTRDIRHTKDCPSQTRQPSVSLGHEVVALPSGTYGWRYAVSEAARLLRAIDGNGGQLSTGGECYPNALNVHDIAHRLDKVLASAQTLAPEPDKASLVKVITSAYESGFGHAQRDELSDPFTPGGYEALAWEEGRKQGRARAKSPIVAGHDKPKHYQTHGSAWTGRQTFTCNLCNRDFTSEHAAMFHPCGPLSETKEDTKQ